MGSSKKTGETIGEVEQITGLPRREIKYCLEQGLIRPRRKSESGYWLYEEEEMEQLRKAALCRRLGIPNPTIREILAFPTPQWRTVLEQQLGRLEKQRRRTEVQLDAVRWLLENLSDPACAETALCRYNEGLRQGNSSASRSD